MDISLIVVEGIHDLMAIYKILKLNEFKEINELQQIPSELNFFIPKKFPFKSNSLDRIVPCPTFMKAGNKFIVLEHTGGDRALIKELNTIYKLSQNTCHIKSVGIVLDADNKSAEDKVAELEDDFNKLESEGIELMFSYNDIKCENATEVSDSIKYYTHVFPNNKDQGVLEDILLEGAEKEYLDLLNPASEYIDNVNIKYKKKWKPSDSKKATVGIIGNILKPSKANSTTIHDNDWFTNNSIKNIETHKLLNEFINKIIGQV